MPRADNDFLNRRAPEPGAPKVEHDKDYPAWRYHKDGRSVMVKTIMEDEALGEGWGKEFIVIDEQPAKDAAAVLEGPQAAFYRTINKLTTENENLAAENMRLANIVQDSEKAKELVELRSKFDISERARKTLQARVDKLEADKIAAKKAAKEKSVAAEESTPTSESPTE